MEIHELQEKTGKCPFIFFSNFLLAIEEAHARWHTTNKTDDYYPAFTFNPNRTFLLGRRLLLELRPRVTLDFDARQSEVEFKEQVN